MSDTELQVGVRYTPDLFSVETGAEESYSFDRGGCLVRAAYGGNIVRWGLDGSCLVKELHAAKADRKRALLAVEDGLAQAAAAYRQAQRLLPAAMPKVPSIWAPVLARVQDAGVQLMMDRAARFQEIYRPVGIMPPDQYGALVLQLTEGCRYNQCAFCTFYKGRPYRVKDEGEFERHIRAVQDMLGEAINRRRTIFLGDANALGLAFSRLVAAFDTINRLLPGKEIYTFMDVFGRNPKAADEFSALAARGLRRVYLGAESGSPEVLQVLRKPNTLTGLISAVTALKAGGVGVGLIILLGAGGRRLADVHTAETASLLAQLPLDTSDTVFFSPLVVEPHSPYAEWAEREGVEALGPAEMREQEQAMRRALREPAQGGPRVTRYDIREFIYY